MLRDNLLTNKFEITKSRDPIIDEDNDYPFVSENIKVFKAIPQYYGI